ncbi:hypothetical protein, partial [Petrotoga sp. DB-2]
CSMRSDIFFYPFCQVSHQPFLLYSRYKRQFVKISTIISIVKQINGIINFEQTKSIAQREAKDE